MAIHRASTHLTLHTRAHKLYIARGCTYKPHIMLVGGWWMMAMNTGRREYRAMRIRLAALANIIPPELS